MLKLNLKQRSNKFNVAKQRILQILTTRKNRPYIFGGLFLVIGVATLVWSSAQVLLPSLEPEDVACNGMQRSSTGASGGAYVRFAANAGA